MNIFFLIFFNNFFSFLDIYFINIFFQVLIKNYFLINQTKNIIKTMNFCKYELYVNKEEENSV